MNTQNPNKFKLLAAFAAIYFVWGTTYLAIRYGVETIPPFLMMGCRSLTGGLILYTWGKVRGDVGFTLNQFPPVILIGFLFFVMGHGVLAWAEQTVPSGVAALLVASEPLWVVALESYFTKDTTLNSKTILGILLGIGGIALLVLPQGFDLQNTNVLGSLGILLGTMTWSVGAVYSRNAKLPRSPLITGGGQLIVGGVLLCLTSFLLGEWETFSLSQVSMRSVIGLAYQIVFGSIVAFSSYTWLLSKVSVTKISTHTFVNPVVAMLVGWTLANEPLTEEMVFATILIVFSVYLVLFRREPSDTDKKDAVEEAVMEGTTGEP